MKLLFLSLGMVLSTGMHTNNTFASELSVDSPVEPTNTIIENQTHKKEIQIEKIYLEGNDLVVLTKKDQFEQGEYIYVLTKDPETGKEQDKEGSYVSPDGSALIKHELKKFDEEDKYREFYIASASSSERTKLPDEYATYIQQWAEFKYNLPIHDTDGVIEGQVGPNQKVKISLWSNYIYNPDVYLGEAVADDTGKFSLPVQDLLLPGRAVEFRVISNNGGNIQPIDWYIFSTSSDSNYIYNGTKSRYEVRS